MKKILFTLCFFFLFFTFSCKKYLDKKSDTSLAVPTTIEDLQALLDNPDIMNKQTPSFGETSSDDYFLLPANYNSLVTLEKDIYNWNMPYNYTFDNDWSKCYLAVYHANLCLNSVEQVKMTLQNELKWKNVKGSAFFFRAYSFMNLATIYCKAYDKATANTDLGIALRLGIDFNVPSARANIEATYTQIIADAKASIELLPTFPAHTYRPSKISAYGLLARVYLSMRFYDSAYRYSDLALQLKNDLIDFKSNNTGDPDNIASNVNSGTAAVFKRFNKETIFYSEMNTSSTVHSTSKAKIDTPFFSTYTNTDIRRTAFVRVDGAYQRFRGSYAQSTSIFFTGMATDEMYLVKAECIARGINGNPGDKDAAMAILNTLLSKRHTSAFTGLTAANSNDALDKILLERRKELVMRGLRWTDIKRLNKEGRNIIPTRNVNGVIFSIQPNSNFYALPLPQDIITVTTMPQNPYQ